jgi:hypothetical protein
MEMTVERPEAFQAQPSPRAAEALLINQLAQAARELRATEALGRRSDRIRAVIRSFRRTLGMIAERGATPDLAELEFAIVCTGEGDPELRSRGRKLPVQGGFLRDCLSGAGVRLQPAQMLLADPDLVRRCVEESLVRLSVEEFRVRQAKADLLQTLQKCSGPYS